MKFISIKEPRATIVAIGILALSVVAFLYYWVTAGWLHFELLTISDNLSGKRGLAQLATILDWHLFEYVSLRMRVLSDATEVIDAAARPWLTPMTGFLPSVTLMAVSIALATVVAFYAAVRRFGVAPAMAIILTAVFVSSIGFQSCFVAYIRPAKKLALLGFCLATWLILRIAQEDKKSDALWLLAVAELVSLADETGLLIFPIALVYLAVARAWRGFVILLAFPLLHVSVAYAFIPYLYSFGPNGMRPHPVLDPGSWRIVSGFIDPTFWRIAFNNLIAETSITLGIIRRWPAALAVCALLLAMCGIVRRPIVLCAVVALCGTVAFASLIDRYNSTAQANRLGGLTYYYHSVTAVAVLFVCATIVASLCTKVQRAAAATLAVVVIIANFVNFALVNEVVERIHIYPLEPSVLAQVRRSLLANQNEPIAITEHEALAFDRLRVLAPSVFGPDPTDPVLGRDMILLQKRTLAFKMGAAPYLRRLVKAFYPERAVGLTTQIEQQ